jgi:hypothetical protein
MGRIFIQKRSDGEFFNTEAFSAYEGFSVKGYEIVPFTLGTGFLDLQRSDIVFGSIWAVHMALDALKIKHPDNMDYPDELKDYLGRNIRETTLGEITSRVFKQADDLPVFIKPSRIHKSFNGFIVNQPKDLIHVAMIGSEAHIYESSLVTFVSEYRTFVFKNTVMDCKHYKGSWRHFPDSDIIDEAVKKYTDCPVAYALDFGVTDKGETLLVEANDFHSLGSYGMDSVDYANCIEARWKEMTK